MGMDNQTFREIQEHLAHFCLPDPGKLVLLGDCAFQTSWSSGDNRKDLITFGAALGCPDAESIDLFGNPTIRRDLTLPIDSGELVGTCDVVLDIGTAMCCSDPMACLRNLHVLLKNGGFAVTLCGITGYFGRAYYNVHPQLLIDLFSHNGYVITMCKIRLQRSLPGTSPLEENGLSYSYLGITQFESVLTRHGIFMSHNRPRHSEIPSRLANEADMLVVARKTNDAPLRMPTPDCYMRCSEVGREPVLLSFNEEEITRLKEL